MALLSNQTIAATGLTPATVAASVGGDTIAPASLSDDRCFLYVNNGSASSITVTVADPGKTPAGNSGTAAAITVAAGAVSLIPIAPGSISAATGLASITYSAVTTVTVASVRR
ncbi:MAG: hypothetical protein HOW97_17140 [Catenulispora sp.]|nr:hypothetical protein [Catenulispora sp.]